MNCPNCTDRTEVTDSRAFHMNTVKRRRRCRCGWKGNTVEVLLTAESENKQRLPERIVFNLNRAAKGESPDDRVARLLRGFAKELEEAIDD